MQLPHIRPFQSLPVVRGLDKTPQERFPTIESTNNQGQLLQTFSFRKSHNLVTLLFLEKREGGAAVDRHTDRKNP